MTRRFYSIAVIVFFAIMAGSLVRDHVLPGWRRPRGIEVDRRVLADSWVNQDDILLISVGGAQVGAIRTTAEREWGTSAPVRRRRMPNEPLPEDTFYTSTSHLELDSFLLKGRVLGSVRMNRRLEVEQVKLRAQVATAGAAVLTPEELWSDPLPAGAYEFVVRLDGTRLRGRLSQGDARQYLETRMDRPPTMVDSMTPILREQMMTEGSVYTLDLYDPVGGAAQAQIEWVATTIERDADGDEQFIREVEVRVGGVATRMWVNQAGVVVRRELPLTGMGGMLGGVGMARAGGDSPAAPNPTTATAGMPKLVLERVDMHVGQAQFPALTFIPGFPEVKPEDVVGRDQGRVLQFNLSSMLQGGRGPAAP